MAEEKPDTPAELKARALRYLVRREHSRAELARKLAPRAESPEALTVLLDHLASRQQLSDERFAEERARSLSRKFGPAKIRQDLKLRGIADEVIEQLSPENEVERARAILARKYRQPPASREERARQARFLQGRGFSYDAIKKALALSDTE